jgi:hypothetical protein
MRDIVCGDPEFAVGGIDEQIDRHSHERDVHVTFSVQCARIVLVHAYGRGGRWA